MFQFWRQAVPGLRTQEEQQIWPPKACTDSGLKYTKIHSKHVILTTGNLSYLNKEEKVNF